MCQESARTSLPDHLKQQPFLARAIFPVASRALDRVPRRLLLVKMDLLSSTRLALAGPSLFLDRTSILTYVGCTPFGSMLLK